MFLATKYTDSKVFGKEKVQNYASKYYHHTEFVNLLILISYGLHNHLICYLLVMEISKFLQQPTTTLYCWNKI